MCVCVENVSVIFVLGMTLRLRSNCTRVKDKLPSTLYHALIVVYRILAVVGKCILERQRGDHLDKYACRKGELEKPAVVEHAWNHHTQSCGKIPQ